MNPYTDTEHVNSQAGDENKLYSQIKLYMYSRTSLYKGYKWKTCMSTQRLRKKKNNWNVLTPEILCALSHPYRKYYRLFFYISLLISLPLLNIQAQTSKLFYPNKSIKKLNNGNFSWRILIIEHNQCISITHTPGMFYTCMLCPCTGQLCTLLCICTCTINTN